MDGLNDIHLLPDSMIYIGEVREEELFVQLIAGSGEVKLCDALLKYLYTSYLHWLKIWKLSCMVDGDEFGPVSWLVRGAAEV